MAITDVVLTNSVFLIYLRLHHGIQYKNSDGILCTVTSGKNCGKNEGFAGIGT